jgi:Zn-dependent protease
LGGLTPDQLGRVLVEFLALLLSLTFHEAAHAATAALLGDRTALGLGRVSLNPWRHVDLLGTIILPLAGALSHLPVIGWAKPVPVDVSQLRRPRWDHLQIAAAGPLSNFLFSALAFALLAESHQGSGTYEAFLEALVWINAYLGIFNLIPLPPLDGGTVATSLLPARLAEGYRRLVAPYGYVLLLALFALHGLDWLGSAAAAYVTVLRRLFAA